MAQHVFTGTTPPGFTPTAVGQHYIDTTTKISYISVGTAASGDWETSDAAAVSGSLITHISDTSNPHSVTKTQIGLSNVDNTSDIDKPVSTAQNIAINTKKTDSMNTNRLLGRGTASTGVIEEISLGAGLSLTGTTLNATSFVVEPQEGDSSYYFTNNSSDLGGGRFEMTKDIPAGGGYGISNTGVLDNDTLAEFASVSGYPNVTYLPSGLLSLRVVANQSGGTKTSQLYAEFYTRTILGVSTLIATSGLTDVLDGTPTLLKANAFMPVVSNLLTTDRLLIIIKASVTGVGTDPDITLNIMGANHSACRFPFEPVSSVNTQVGAVVLTKSDIGLGNVDNTSDINKPVSTAQQTALDLKQNNITVNNNQFIYSNSSGSITGAPNVYSNTNSGGILINPTIESDDNNYISINNFSLNIEPLQDSLDENYAIISNSVYFDNNDSGFNQGTNGVAARFIINYADHNGSGDIGSLNFIENNFNLGNGTDSINVRGIGYLLGFGQISDNVTITSTIQGYGFQPNVASGAVISASGYTQAFYDAANYNTETVGYTSFNSTPNITSIANNHSFNGVNISPNISDFNGNAGFIGANIGGVLGNFNSGGSYQGVNVNPTISSARYTVGLNVSMDNVTPYAGVQSSLTEQDLTITFNQASSYNNSYTLEYTTGGTAGSEVVSITGFNIEIQIEDGVSTATQIKDAIEAATGLNTAVSVVVTGVGSNPQDIFGPLSFANGEDPGTVKAAYLDGDVEITGDLSFGGGLSIGKLDAFYSQNFIDSPGVPVTFHGLITSPTIGDNVTLTNADTIAVNTAALITIGDNSSIGTSFIGVAALGLPAVLTMGSGSTLDRCYASLFALSLDAAAGGGTVDEVGLCKAIAIPNGSTTITNLIGFLMDLPFGDPGTTSWGFYERPGIHNYMQGDLLIGGTAGSDDVVTNSSVGLELKSTTKAFVASRMTTTERDALTAINGMVLYNVTTNKLQVYSSGSWVDLH
jgi:hypothetical protein